MSASCCGQDAQFDGVSAAFKRALWIVIAINGAMFIVEMAAGPDISLAKMMMSSFNANVACATE